MFVFDMLYNIILLFSLVATFSALIFQGLENELGGELDFSLQGAGIDFAVALSIYFFMDM